MSPSLDESALLSLKQRYGVGLPEGHVNELQRHNGVEVYGGYYRLFGVGTTERIDLLWWNDFERWKFAWPASLRLHEYFCFAESAWGHQYAYRVDELKRNPDDAPVYDLDALSMIPEPMAMNFGAFGRMSFSVLHNHRTIA